jgi:hypothetical protein
VRVNPEGGIVVAGRAAPQSTVTVTSDSQPLGKVIANAQGEWVLTPDTNLQPGNHEISITADAGAGKSVPSDDIVVVVVPQPKAAGQTQTASNEPQQPLAVVVPRSDTGSTVLQAPNPPHSGLLVLQSVDYDADGMLIIGGQAPPKSEVRAYLDRRQRTLAYQARPDGRVRPAHATHRRGGCFGPGDRPGRIAVLPGPAAQCRGG